MNRTSIADDDPDPELTADLGDAEAQPSTAPKDAPATEHRPGHAPQRIRSYVLRAGRIGPGQQRAIDTLGQRFVLPYAAEPLDLDEIFGRAARVVLDIGFGMGDATAQLAAAAPEVDVLGVEVHPPGVGALLKQVGERGLGNVRIVQHDVVDVLQHMLAPGSLHGAQLHFPDPWHKTRHHKRRLVQPAFVALLASRLVPGGLLQFATDWAPYAEHMLAVLSAEPTLANTVEGCAPRPESRPLTKFEQRGLRLGHGVWDMAFRRR